MENKNIIKKYLKNTTAVYFCDRFQKEIPFVVIKENTHGFRLNK